jgi:hypothetical protein
MDKVTKAILRDKADMRRILKDSGKPCVHADGTELASEFLAQHPRIRKDAHADEHVMAHVVRIADEVLAEAAQ